MAGGRHGIMIASKDWPKMRGFTLIELLIVVAIIAVLAAIAVPNFLEAQVRSKVSRVRSDLRSLATGQETYFTDWNSYTNRDIADDPVRLEGWGQLTTPIAYVTSIPYDPFGQSGYVSGGTVGLNLPARYELGAGAVGVGSAGPPGNPGPGFPSNTYEMNSNGPDKRDDSQNPSTIPWRTLMWHDAGYPWEYIPADNDLAAAECLSMIYDPTNGTKSAGDIFRTGGAKPPGRVFDILFGVGSGQ